MTKRKLPETELEEPALKKQNINDEDNVVSTDQENDSDIKNKEEEIKKWKEEGKMEGLAYGVLALFNQDAIKKPSEMINGKFLNLPDNIAELEVIEAVIDLYSDNIPKTIELIIEFMRGNREKVVANIIKDDYLKYNDMSYIPENLYITKSVKKQLKAIENPSVEDITTILLGQDDG